MKKITLQEEDIDYIINLIDKTKDEISEERYEELIQRLKKAKSNIISHKDRDRITEHTREIHNVYSRINYYLKKRNKNENDDIKLQMYIDKFNRISALKQMKIVDGKIFTERKK